MKGRTIHVLLIEDSPVDSRFVVGVLAGTSDPRFAVEATDTISSGLARLALGRIDVVLLDLNLPDSDGLATFRRVQAAMPAMPVVVLSGDEDEEGAVDAVQAGAQDYLVKGRYTRDLLTRSLRYAIERMRSQEVLSELAQRLTHHVDNSPLAVVEWGPDLDIIRWAGEAERIFGWKSEEVLGKRFQDLHFVHAEDDADVQEIILGLQSGAHAKNFSANRNHRKDGSVVYCEWYNSALMDTSGRLCSILSLALDVTERKQAEAGLTLANGELRKLSLDLLRSQDEERRRIARELHDSTAQVIAALSMNLNRLRNSELDPRRKQALLEESIALATASSREIRTVTYLLHPPLLDEIGLVSALQTYVEGFDQRSGIHIDLNVPPNFGRLDGALEMALFRITQEGLANVLRHSGSTIAAIALERDDTEVRLMVQDRGRGLLQRLDRAQSGPVRLGVGILGMRERAEQLGGGLEISSDAGGTLVAVRLPLTKKDGRECASW